MKMTFRPTTLADITVMPAIERSAGQRFRDVPALAWIADGPVISVEQHREHAAKGLSWLALADERPVGFLLAEALDSSLFIAEVSLLREWQGKGIGRQLIAYVAEQARSGGFDALTLTTFRDVAWNAPLYARMGFVVLDDERLSPGLRQKREEEAAHGLAYESRCAMRLRLV
ncbi:TPA: GNAT family N-acetyltransferase [Citrobacter koseri]